MQRLRRPNPTFWHVAAWYIVHWGSCPCENVTLEVTLWIIILGKYQMTLNMIYMLQNV